MPPRDVSSRPACSSSRSPAGAAPRSHASTRACPAFRAPAHPPRLSEAIDRRATRRSNACKATQLGRMNGASRSRLRIRRRSRAVLLIAHVRPPGRAVPESSTSTRETWVMNRVGAAPCQWCSPGIDHDTVPGADDLDRAIALLREPDPFRHVEGLTVRMRVPRRPRAGREVHADRVHARPTSRRRHRVEVDIAGEPLLRPDRGVTPVPGDLHLVIEPLLGHSAFNVEPLLQALPSFEERTFEHGPCGRARRGGAWRTRAGNRRARSRMYARLPSIRVSMYRAWPGSNMLHRPSVAT